MANITKPRWWDDLAHLYGYTDTATLTDSDMMKTLHTSVGPDIDRLSSSAFLATQASVIHDTKASTMNRINILAIVTPGEDVVLGHGGTDYVAGGAGDDILLGGYGNDLMNPGAGNDLVIGSDKVLGVEDTDTVSYRMATSGIVVKGFEYTSNNQLNAFTYVSKDGFGGYDVLSSVENVTGSDFNDQIHAPTLGKNIIYGGAGTDYIWGEDGNDILSGDQGNDYVYGGAGDDLLLLSDGSDRLYGEAGRDTFKLTGAFFDTMANATFLIQDFQVGPGGDKLDVSEILDRIGYHGSDAVADGYIVFKQGTGGLNINIDLDGRDGPLKTDTIGRIMNVSPSEFSVADNLITEAPKTLFIGIMGQSNASGLRVFGDDNESAVSIIEKTLKQTTDFINVSAMQRDAYKDYISMAVGSSTVDGDEPGHDPDRIWWYPNSGKPGDDAIRAVDILVQQIADARAAGAVTPMVIWGQGEADAYYIGKLTSESARLAAEQRYMDATRAVFDYIKEHAGSDVQFYIMETGRFQPDGARVDGMTEKTIQAKLAGLEYIYDAQEQLAMQYKDIHLAVNYHDLSMLAEVPSSYPEYDPSDYWHLSWEARDTVGERVADFIALELGYDNVLDDPGPYPRHVLSDITLKAGPGMTINGNEHDNIIVGTMGNDTIHGNGGKDVIMGAAGNDMLYGDAGSDIFYYDQSVVKEVQAAAANPSLNIRDIITGFETGANGDQIDVSELLRAAGYHGSNAVADGYVKIAQQGGNTVVSFDDDGSAGAHAAVAIAQLNGVTASDFDPQHNLITAIVATTS